MATLASAGSDLAHILDMIAARWFSKVAAVLRLGHRAAVTEVFNFTAKWSEAIVRSPLPENVCIGCCMSPHPNPK